MDAKDASPTSNDRGEVVTDTALKKVKSRIVAELAKEVANRGEKYAGPSTYTRYGYTKPGKV
jgi:hypothetical protein